MKACKILLLVIALLIAGCQNQVTEEKKTDTETITSTLSEWDTYTNLDSLMTSYQIATSSNVRSTLAKERIYLIDDNNPWDTALVIYEFAKVTLHVYMIMILLYIHIDFPMVKKD